MSQKFEELYSRLNVDQKKAVDTIEGPVLVIAGPGTGKTQVLSLRIANILRQTDVLPKSILCLTFTEAGVFAMKNRLQKIIGNDAFKVNIHTFHSFCSEIIRSFPHEFNFTEEVATIKDIDKLGIFKEILTENKLVSLQQRNDILGNFRGISSAISNLKKEFINPDQFLSHIKIYEENLDPKKLKLEIRKIEKMYALQEFYKKYLELMKERSLIDFDDMIFKVTEGFSKNDDLVKYFQEQYLYTLVDEFQDTNSSQLEVIKAVGSFEGLDANIFAVGDDDQTIFRFQGARSENFQNYLDVFPNTEVIVLHTNYRSNQEVIDASTNVISNNENRISDTELFESRGLDKNFVAFSEFENLSAGELERAQIDRKVQIHEFEHSFHEDYWIGEKIQKLVDSGTKYSDIAIITRVNRQIVNITKFLDRFKIPYQIKRSESILDDRNIQNLLQLFAIIAEPVKLKDDKIMWEILSQEFLGLNSFDIFSLVHEAKKNKTNMFDFVQKTHLPKYEAIYKFLNIIIGLQQYSRNNNFTNTFTKTIHVLELVKYLEKLPESYAHINRLSSLFQFVSTRSRFLKNYEIDTFLAETKLMREKNILLSIDPFDIEAENKTNILTAHSSKGLEFDHVFIYQCSENKWENYKGGRDAISLPPMGISESENLRIGEVENKNGELRIHKLQLKEEDEEEIEERRLFYVAMTRAKKDLFLTYSKKYFDSDSGELDASEKNISKFLIEAKVTDPENHDELISKHSEILEIILSPEEPVVIPEKNRDYLKNLVLKNLDLSASKVNKYENCHYKFLLEDVFRIPTSPSLNLEIGTAVHHGIELLTKSVKKENNETTFLSFDEVLKMSKESFESKIDKDELDKEEIGSIDVAYEEIERGLRAYYDYFVLNPDKPEHSELVALGNFDGIRLRGRIDKISSQISYSDYVNLVITDYKTTSKIPSITEFLGLNKNSDKAQLRQLMFYKLLVENSQDFRIKKLANRIGFLKIEYIDTKLGEVKSYEIPVSGIYAYKPRANAKSTQDFNVDHEYLNFKEDLKKVFGQIQNLEFDRTEDRRICQFCQFKRHCNRL